MKKIDIEKEWVRHIESYVKQIVFPKESLLNIPKCVYVFEVLMKLKEKKVELPTKVQEQFVLKVMK